MMIKSLMRAALRALTAISISIGFIVPMAFANNIPVEVFAQLPAVSSLRLSPDGQYLAMLQPVSGRRHLIIQRSDGSASPVVIPPLDESEITEFHWANNDRIIIHMSSRSRLRNIELTQTRLLAVNKDGSEYENLVRTNVKTTGTSRIQNKWSKAQIQDRVVSYLPNDPDHILLAIDEKFDGLSDLRMIDINTSKFDLVRDAMRGVQDWMSDNEGRPRLGWGVDTQAYDMGRTTSRFTYYAGTDDNFSELPEDHIGNTLDPLGFAENPELAYMAGSNDYGRTAVVKANLTTGEIVETVFSSEQYDAIGLVRDPLSDVPIGIRYVSEQRQAEIFDADWAKRYRTINGALPDTYNSVVSTTTDRNLHIVFATGPKEPGMYYLYDEGARQIHPLALSYNNLEPNQLAEVRPVTYEARDGTAIPSYLTLPNGSDGKNLPTVVLPHGGPYVRDTMEFDYIVQFLANRGYAVLQPNFRGSSGYGNAFRRAGYEQWGLLMQDDVTDGTKWLVEQGIADPKRICIVGGSYGGYAALMGAAKEPDLYACAISFNGVTDMERLVVRAKDFIGGTVMTQHINQENQAELSPVNLAGSIKAPVLLVHAEDDMRVEFRQAKDMAKALKRAKVKHRFVELEVGGHSLEHARSRLQTLQEIEKWLDKYIGN